MFEDISKEIIPVVQSLKLVRLDKTRSNSTSVMLVVPDEESPIDAIINKLYALDQDMKITFFEAKTNW